MLLYNAPLHGFCCCRFDGGIHLPHLLSHVRFVTLRFGSGALRIGRQPGNLKPAIRFRRHLLQPPAGGVLFHVDISTSAGYTGIKGTSLYIAYGLITFGGGGKFLFHFESHRRHVRHIFLIFAIDKTKQILYSDSRSA